MRPLTACIVGLSLLAAAPLARAADLTIGDPAPALDVGKWVQGILDTLARAHAVKGDWDQAAAVQQKAVDQAVGDGPMKAELQRALTAYKAKQLPKEE